MQTKKIILLSEIEEPLTINFKTLKTNFEVWVEETFERHQYEFVRKPQGYFNSLAGVKFEHEKHYQLCWLRWCK